MVLVAERPSTADAGRDDIGGRTYRELISEAASQSPSPMIVTRDHKDAAVVTEFLFRTAQKEVLLLTRALSKDVYDDSCVVEAALQFLTGNADSRIDILVETKVTGRTSEFLARTVAAAPGRVCVHFVPTAVQASYSCNFAVTDTGGVRFEVKRETRDAAVQFNGSELAAGVRKIFEGLSAYSEEYQFA